MKKILILLMTLLLTAECFYGCASHSQSYDDNHLQIVTTIFPEYDWVKSILGDNKAEAEVTMLLNSGVDLHSFQPSAADILKISTCDMFVYVGGESDEWVDDVLKQATNKEMIIINLLEILGNAAKEEEIVEGMQENEREEHDHEEEAEYDEHVWLSLKNAVLFVNTITEALTEIDSDHADSYRNNAQAYINELKKLDEQYQETVTKAPFKTLLFGDRFPFRYMIDDYGLNYYAAFVGCSAETEASFETVTFLAQKVDELSLPAVLTIEGTSHRIAETIIQNTAAKNQSILVMDSMQSTTNKDVKNGATYLSIMQKNLSVLKDALN
ncbi:MAG: zinc ABC transporter substrate-binding protein [Erysipelotrichaceae bacterium]|nr:zinc ABC transporter substrate-binding protein [Erysipelotrichaceae bacterium]